MNLKFFSLIRILIRVPAPLRLIICLFVLVSPLNAQQTTGLALPYAWEAGDLALTYPSGWEAPAPAEEERRVVLRMAQTLVNEPLTRPPGTPFITITIIAMEDPNVDLYPFLETTLDAIGIFPQRGANSFVAGSGAVTA